MCSAVWVCEHCTKPRSALQTGWAAGDNGRILKTTTGGFTAIQPISNEIPEGFSLFQNYPNPFNPETKIKFDIPSLIRRGAGVVVLKIYDILGREVATLVNEPLQPGTYEVEWDGSQFASGIYYYQLTAKPFDRLERSDGYQETNKMILLK